MKYLKKLWQKWTFRIAITRLVWHCQKYPELAAQAIRQAEWQVKLGNKAVQAELDILRKVIETLEKNQRKYA